jgi:hypothetical protein
MKELIIYGLATGVLNLLLSERSRVDSWCASRPRMAAALKLLRAVGLDPWHVVSATNLLVRGKLPAAMRRGEP